MWPDGYIIYSTFFHLQQWTFGQYHKLAKVGSKFCQIWKKHSKITKYFDMLANVAIFHKIWLHCFLLFWIPCSFRLLRNIFGRRPEATEAFLVLPDRRLHGPLPASGVLQRLPKYPNLSSHRSIYPQPRCPASKVFFESGLFWKYSLIWCHYSVWSGWGSAGRVVASDTWGPRFEYSHEQILLERLDWRYWRPVRRVLIPIGLFLLIFDLPITITVWVST